MLNPYCLTEIVEKQLLCKRSNFILKSAPTPAGFEELKSDSS